MLCPSIWSSLVIFFLTTRRSLSLFLDHISKYISKLKTLLGFARTKYQDMAEKTSETAPAVSDYTETPKLVGEAISPDTHEKGLIKPSSPAASSSTSENGDAAALEKAEQAVEGPKSPRDIHGVKWALAVISILAVTFLFVSTMIIIFSPPRSPT